MHDITGKSLGKSEAGIAHSIKVPLKKDSLGVCIIYTTILVNVLPPADWVQS